MDPLNNNRLVRAFADLRKEGKKTVLPFIPAGFPDLDITEALLRDFEARGVRVCELGIPFSDPVADGPVIQASYTEALSAGITSDKIFETVRRFRGGTGVPPVSADNDLPDRRDACPTNACPTQDLALVAMVSYSIVFRHGVEQYIRQAADAGIDGLIIPDLPLDEAAGVEQLAAANGLANIMLIAPTTPRERQLEIARHSRGFIYYISVSGITGERDRLPQATIDGVIELRKQVQTPVCVGFGIAKPEMVRTVCQVADGAIVGSAIVHRISDAMAKKLSREELVKQVGAFVSELLAPINSK
jgi:tryptophan synthase alpha chain